jgi:hypothetical protein
MDAGKITLGVCYNTGVPRKCRGKIVGNQKAIERKGTYRMAVTRPLLKYHGGKWLLAPWILSYMPEHKVYVEPFGGGGSVLLRKNRAHEEVYNDLDREIVNLFRVVRDNGNDLRRKLELTPYSREEFELSYEPTDDPIEKARRTVVRSFMGRNPASATQAAGSFKGKQVKSYITIAHVWRKYPDAMADALNAVKGKIILSGYPSELYDSLYRDWERVEKNSVADGHLPRKKERGAVAQEYRDKPIWAGGGLIVRERDDSE